MKRLIPLLLCGLVGTAFAQQNLSALNDQSSLMSDFKVRNLPLGSGIPGNEGSFSNAWSVAPGLWEVAGYLPYYPTAATIWPRVVQINCNNGVCDGYNVIPALGRGEYLYIQANVVSRPAAPTAEHFTLGADALFDFDSATLKPGGRSKLDDLASKLQSVKGADIAITGYTDSIGSTAYNDRLSLRRAQAVRSYLIGKGIPSAHVSASGKGMNDLIATGCPKGKSAASIACQAPNRRVEVQVTGIK
jgi:outer membrane protein OmpA-like peptidoglycan-associated protein